MNIEQILNEIIEDRKSGSTQIVLKTCELMERALSLDAPDKDWNRMLQEIVDAHKPMAVLHRFKEYIYEGGHPRDFLKMIERRTKDAGSSVLSYITENKVERVMTMSSSSAVEHALSDFDGKIYVMESRPMLEGTVMAERLSEKGRDVTVLTDAFGISVVARGKVDAVIIGADGVYKNMIINKVGSYALYVAAEHSGTEFIVVITSDKIFPEGIELSDDEVAQYHEPGEITDKVRAINPYFESFPMTESMKIFTEDGMKSLQR